MKLLSGSQMSLINTAMDQGGDLLQMDQQPHTYTTLQNFAPSNKQLPTNKHTIPSENHSSVNQSVLNQQATSHGYTSLDKPPIKQQAISQGNTL